MKTKEEVLSIIKTKPNGNIEEFNFKKKFPELYQELSTWNFPSDFKFIQKLYHYFNDDPELKLGLCPVCKNRCSFIKFNKITLFIIFYNKILYYFFHLLNIISKI